MHVQLITDIGSSSVCELVSQAFVCIDKSKSIILIIKNKRKNPRCGGLRYFCCVLPDYAIFLLKFQTLDNRIPNGFEEASIEKRNIVEFGISFRCLYGFVFFSLSNLHRFQKPCVIYFHLLFG